MIGLSYWKFLWKFWVSDGLFMKLQAQHQRELNELEEDYKDLPTDCTGMRMRIVRQRRELRRLNREYLALWKSWGKMYERALSAEKARDALKEG